MKKMRKILLIVLVLGLILGGCSTLKGSHSIKPISQNQIVIERGKIVSVVVSSTIATEDETKLFKQYLVTTLESKGLHSTSASNTADFKITVDIIELKRVTWPARFLWGIFAGRGETTAVVEIINGINTSKFIINAKAPKPSFGLGAAGLGLIKENGTTRMAFEEAAKQIAERVTYGP